jgi:hypothetical protein
MRAELDGLICSGARRGNSLSTRRQLRDGRQTIRFN